ncbi:hypothetical protein BJV78DRAFT_1282913 [Lactifluus subvellereus]|nr:hypothetical protein BJV78DRAFT_1282913 [Lactifluus subvellereus]
MFRRAQGVLFTIKSSLSALNFVRLALSKGYKGEKDGGLSLPEILSWETAEFRQQYLEEALLTPLFHLTLHLRATKFGRPNDEGFRRLLIDLGELIGSAGLVIVRSAEAIACVKLRLAQRNVFVIFRANLQRYPYSAQVSADTSLENTARQLAMLTPAELLANFTAYILVPRKVYVDSAALTEALIKSSLALLSLREKATNLRSRNSTLTSDTKRLEASSRKLGSATSGSEE